MFSLIICVLALILYLTQDIVKNTIWYSLVSLEISLIVLGIFINYKKSHDNPI